MGSLSAIQADSILTAASERIADIVGAEFWRPWSERQLYPKAVIRSA
jgi:hypothetical protein